MKECKDESAPTASASTTAQAAEDEKRKMLMLFKEESAKCESWRSKYIADSMFVLGSGAYGSVFQVTTHLYNNKQSKASKNRQMYHPNFISTMASQRKLRPDAQDKLRDRTRDKDLLDIIAIKFEMLQQPQLEDGATRFFLFLRREFLVLDTIWRKSWRILHGFPVVFDFGYVGDKGQFGVISKYRNIFTYLNLEGEEVKFFTDVNNRNLEGVTKISYMSMELLGPSIDDIRIYFEPWYSAAGLRTFFQIRTAFLLADQILCRLLVLHKCGFVHHDIKPDNVCMGNGRTMNVAYLLDFGFAKQVSNNRPPEWMGSRKFIAVDTYSGAKPNYAQDIESWFYLLISLLYDALPWTDEFILPLLGDRADENARWNLVQQIKKSWWADASESSLKDIIKSIATLHSSELPDVKTILEQLHKRTRDLRAIMRAINDAQTLNFELANNQSTIFRGYMSVRKALLQIFNLPQIGENALLGDSEFRSLQQARSERNLPTYDIDRSNFHWEWDVSHASLCKNHAVQDLSNAMGLLSPNNWQGSTAIAEAYGGTDIRASRASLGSLLVMSHPVAPRHDEVSYAFDRRRSLLLPKSSGQRHAGVRLPPVRFYGDERTIDGGWQGGDKESTKDKA